ncbi:MAG: site-2 protease family protein [Gemmatimonadetes bacterium]|nr:site-2 protease family protein [Gemmatimonadota bacterium]MYB97178.1 site-2 protease family protein [Gemmatimonadota bacterium]MYI45589.1 site-2 protease family protein [Gemmatimonadota bacterium]
MPAADPAWDNLLVSRGVGRAGGYRVVRGRLRPDVSAEDLDKIAKWADQVHTRAVGDETELVAVRREAPPHRDSLTLHLFLFVAALGSAVVAGGFLSGTDILDTRFSRIGGVWLPVPTGFEVGEMVVGLAFGLTFIGILLGHEMGHYLTARRHAVSVSLPWFIPFPPYFSLVGTLGAFIRLKSPMMRRSVLFDIGVAGPLASFALSLPVLLLGLSLSEVMGTTDGGLQPFVIHFAGEPIRIGSNILVHLAAAGVVPGFEEGSTVLLHPVAFAGWLGIFVTALNLMPLGQLDGGHILYAVAGARQRAFTIAFIAVLVPLGFLWWGWWLWGVIALALSRGRLAHPPVLVEDIPVGRGRTILGWVALVLFAISFSPAPLEL